MSTTTRDEGPHLPRQAVYGHLGEIQGPPMARVEPGHEV